MLPPQCCIITLVALREPCLWESILWCGDRPSYSDTANPGFIHICILELAFLKCCCHHLRRLGLASHMEKRDQLSQLSQLSLQSPAPTNPPLENGCLLESRWHQQKNPESWEIINHCCFTLVNFGMICCSAIDNRYIHTQVYFYVYDVYIFFIVRDRIKR